MPAIKRNWTALFGECPFIDHKINSLREMEEIQFKNLTFNDISFSSKKDRRVKYGFVAFTREKAGAFVLRDRLSNKILAIGSSSTDLYEQIVLHIRRYKILIQDAVLAVVVSPQSLVDSVLQKIKQSYLAQPTDDVYHKIIPFFKKEQVVPLEEIRFFPLFASTKSIRHVSRIKTNIAYLQFRPGVYLISEKEIGAHTAEIVYVGKATNLNGRIYAHFVKSQIENHGNANYLHKLDTHEYSVGVIEFPRQGMADYDFRQHLLSVERYIIKQIDPRDNRKHKITLEGGFVPFSEEDLF